MIIFLNGTSSSGKSVIAREIMHQSERPFICFSIDHFVNFWIDGKFISFGEESKEWFFQQPAGGVNILDAPMVEGPSIPTLHWDMIGAFAELVKKGYDLIIDEVLWSPDIFPHFIALLAESDRVYLVKVICELMICEQRESLRPDRYKGLTRSLYHKVYVSPPDYDLEVDTTSTSAKNCAANILKFIQGESKPLAFKHYLKNSVSFQALTANHFSLLSQWLNMPMVAQWWGEGKRWDLAAVEEKCEENKKEKKQIQAYIISCSEKPIGYIQYYRAKEHITDGSRALTVAGVDLYFGDPSYTERGFGAFVLELFLTQFVWEHFEACLVKVDANNEKLINLLESARFQTIKQLPPHIWMLRKNNA